MGTTSKAVGCWSKQPRPWETRPCFSAPAPWLCKWLRRFMPSSLQPDGRLLSESAGGPQSEDLAWWVHAEAMVGFYNAYQISGQEHFAVASTRVWDFIMQNFSDHQNGDWFKTLDLMGRPYPDSPKVGPWECPYHHSRACFEMLKRLP